MKIKISYLCIFEKQSVIDKTAFLKIEIKAENKSIMIHTLIGARGKMQIVHRLHASCAPCAS